MSAPKKKKSPRLGRGLSSLMAHPVSVSPSASVEADADLSPSASSRDLEIDPAQACEGLTHLSIDAIRANPHQPREQFDSGAMQSLADSIRSQGLMQPVVVRQVPRGTSDLPQGITHELVAGERRWRAARLAGLDVLPAIVRELDDQQMAEWALIENLQREDLNPMERAEAFARLADRFKLSHDAIAHRVGVERSTVSNLLRLLALALPVQQLVREGLLSMGQARALAGLSNLDQQASLAHRAVREALSVRAVERAVATMSQMGSETHPTDAPSIPVKSTRPAHLADLESQIGQQLGSKVRLKPGRKKGTGNLTIEFYSLDQFDELLKKLGVATE